MPKVPLFQGGSYSTDSPNWAADRSVNLFTEIGESGTTKSPMRLRGSPGLHTFCTLPSAPVRGIWVNEYRLFAAAGSRFYEVFSNGSFQDRGYIGDDATHSQVQVFPNGISLLIVSAGVAYLDTGTEILALNMGTLTGTVVTGINGLPPGAQPPLVTWAGGDLFDPDMVGNPVTIGGVVYTVVSVRGDGKEMTISSSPGYQVNLNYSATLALRAKTGAFLDGYYIVAPPDNKVFRISGLYDGATWDPIDNGVKEGYPDNIASILADHEELWLFGTETTEIWRNEGNNDFPFQRDMGAFIHQGCAAPWSVCRLNNGVAWLGGDSRGRITAWRAQGFVPVRISTHAVEQAWKTYSEVSDAISFTYRMDGHEFMQVTFPTGDATWVYDALAGLWHERDAYGSGHGRHRANCHGYVWGKSLVGDFENGKIYESSTSFYDDAGSVIRRLRQAPHLSTEQLRNFFHRIQLDMQTGAGVANPAMTLEWSDDGGHTWSTPITVTAGALNEYTHRVIWRRLGDSRDRVWRITSTAAILHCWIDALIDLTRGTS